MPTNLEQATTDHRHCLQVAAEAAGIADPVAIDFDEFEVTILTSAQRGPFTPLNSALVRTWDRTWPKFYPGMRFGIRIYSLEGIRFARCHAEYSEAERGSLGEFFVVGRADYIRLFRMAVRLRRSSAVPEQPPVLPPALLDTLRRNTIGYLQRDNLKRIRSLGGRARRGLLLSGPPGNGKTSACRWLWQECHRLRYEYRIVTPDMYRQARASCNSVQAVKELFDVSKRGIVFFDDLDVALRDRTLAPESDDQAVFLGALDGIESHEGVVYVFTTNCPIVEIDPAFKRPGRIDLVLQFDPPNAELRRQLIDRWHDEILAGLDLDRAVSETNGWSFAEIEEIKNLLILFHMDHNDWNWDRAMKQYEANRHDLTGKNSRSVGFHLNGRVTQ